MRRTLCITCLSLTAILMFAATALAHKVNIFAYVDGNTVVTDSGYSRTKRVHDGTVEVYDKGTGTMLLSGITDDNGKFDFTIPAEARANQMDLLLRLKAGAGHQAEWVVSYDEYNAVKGPFAATQPEHGHKAISTPQQMTDAREVEAIIHRELAPVKQMLAELNQPGPGMTEIIGGIGYIFGLFGIAAYMKSRSQ